MQFCRIGFPHSDIFGSTVARHLPEAYRRHAASFIAFPSQGIHHALLRLVPVFQYLLPVIHDSIFKVLIAIWSTKNRLQGKAAPNTQKLEVWPALSHMVFVVNTHIMMYYEYRRRPYLRQAPTRCVVNKVCKNKKTPKISGVSFPFDYRTAGGSFIIPIRLRGICINQE